MDKILKKLIVYLSINRILLLTLTFLISNNNALGDHSKNFTDFLTKYGVRWDGNSYSFLAHFGYTNMGDAKNYIVFPPVYPAIVRPLGHLIGNYPLAGMLASNIFFVLACIIFFKLLKFDYSEKFSLYVIFLISIFPTSFFFSVAYPESLFFLIFALTFYFIRLGKFNASLVFASLAPIIRPFGIAIYPSLFVSLLTSKKRDLAQLTFLIFSFLLPAFIYLFINYKVFGNPLAFSEILKQNWHKSFAFPWNGILDSWKRGIFTPEWGEYKFMIGYTEAFASTLAWFFTLTSFVYKKFRLNLEYSIYLLMGVFLFTSTGFILSAPRYLLSLPPIFIILAKASESKLSKFVLIPISVFLLFYFSIRWAEGWWAF